MGGGYNGDTAEAERDGSITGEAMRVVMNGREGGRGGRRADGTTVRSPRGGGGGRQWWGGRVVVDGSDGRTGGAVGARRAGEKARTMVPERLVKGGVEEGQWEWAAGEVAR